MKRNNLKYLILFALSLLMTSCLNELETEPQDNTRINEEELFSNPESYKQFLAKLYAGFATTGQQGPAGNGDVAGIDEGFSQYLRNYWNLQELTTDEAIIAWNDQTIKNFHWHTWTANDVFLNATYARIAFQISICNEYLRLTSDSKLDERGVTGTLREQIKTYRAEAKFLRAISYWHLLDLFGGGSIVTENASTDYFIPDYATKAQLYAYLESELLGLVGDLKDPNSNEKYRADKAAAWMLLSKLYMNAEAYIGQNKYAEAYTYIDKVINQTSYSLHSNYRQLFLADNDINGAQNEFIFTIAFDGLHTKTYGGTTYLVHAPVGGNMNASEYGINGGWAGLRTTSAFVNKFNGLDGDLRKQFHTSGQTLEIAQVGTFTDGYAIGKWRNVRVDGSQGSDPDGNFADTDFPIFRLADAYLMYAECAARGGGGSLITAASYINQLRTRANSPTITAGDITLDFILDERGRELHWEGHRRTDLIRFGKFTGSSYIWPWKGNVPNGAPTASYRNVFPIPTQQMISNNKLIQNPGY